MSWKDFVKTLEGVELEENKDLTKLSTMRLRAFGDLITVHSEEALCELVRYFSENKQTFRVIGWGANQLLKESVPFPYVKLKLPFDKSYLENVRSEYILPASVSLSVLSSHAVKHGLSGWEVFTGIPSSLGGALIMNAGTNLGEICNVVKNVRVVGTNGEIYEHSVEKDSFSYRKNNFIKPGEVIVGATLTHHGQSEEISVKIKDYLALRNRTQPLKENTCGCVFKNTIVIDEFGQKQTCLAGKSIDIIGLKGFTHKGIRVSPKHANFMENFGGGSYSDMVELIEIVQKELKLHFGVEFETEVKL